MLPFCKQSVKAYTNPNNTLSTTHPLPPHLKLLGESSVEKTVVSSSLNIFCQSFDLRPLRNILEHHNHKLYDSRRSCSSSCPSFIVACSTVNQPHYYSVILQITWQNCGLYSMTLSRNLTPPQYIIVCFK